MAVQTSLMNKALGFAQKFEIQQYITEPVRYLEFMQLQMK